MMHICSGLVGPKSGNVEKPSVLLLFVEGSRRPGVIQDSENSAKKNEKNEEKGASTHEMASMMHICSGLVGPKSGNVEKVLVFKGFFEGSRTARRRQENEQPSEPECFFVEKRQKTSKKKKDEPLDMRWRYDAYMYGLGGTKSENVEKPLVLKVFLKGSKGARAPQECKQLVEKCGF